MTYFSINSTVIYTYMLDITDLLWEVVPDDQFLQHLHLEGTKHGPACFVVL